MKKSRGKKIGTIISFVVDGKCELWYLQLLKQHEKLNAKNINLEPKLPEKKKLSDLFDLAKKLAEDSEKVFLIIDLDTILKETRERKKGEKAKLQEFRDLCNDVDSSKIIIVVNNPCLEYWFLLHFEQTSKPFSTYKQLEKSLKNHLPHYEKKETYYKNRRENIYQKLRPKLEHAILNSKKSGEFDFENTTKGIAEMHKIFNELNIGNS